MTHPERVEDYLEHIMQAIHRATRYIQHLDSAASLRHSEQTQDAVVRNIEIIGEAASRIQLMLPEFVVSHPELPWIEMRGMRNKMIHEYFDVDWDIVWRTVRDDLPALRQQIEDVLTTRRLARE
ncbi:MAG: hypothetical protein JWQ55_4697 [Rhodopila sp.]|nr:hypothetical protein [Rhodopila sp.]